MGGYAEVAEGEDRPELYLRGAVVAVDGSASIRRSITGPVDDAPGVGRMLAAELVAEGADNLIGERAP